MGLGAVWPKKLPGLPASPPSGPRLTFPTKCDVSCILGTLLPKDVGGKPGRAGSQVKTTRQLSASLVRAWSATRSLSVCKPKPRSSIQALGAQIVIRNRKHLEQAEAERNKVLRVSEGRERAFWSEASLSLKLIA